MVMHTSVEPPDQQPSVPSGTTFRTTQDDARAARVAVSKLPYYGSERALLLQRGLRLIAAGGQDLPWVNLEPGRATD